MLAFAIDRGDQFRKGHAALLRDLFQTVPELAFKANARLVACNDNRALRNQRLHGFSPANEPAVASCPNELQGLSQTAGPSRILQTDPARAQCTPLLIADCGLRSLGYCRPTLISFPPAPTQNPSLVA